MAWAICMAFVTQGTILLAADFRTTIIPVLAMVRDGAPVSLCAPVEALRERCLSPSISERIRARIRLNTWNQAGPTDGARLCANIRRPTIVAQFDSRRASAIDAFQTFCAMTAGSQMLVDG